MIFELSQQAKKSLLKFVNCRLRNDFGHAISVFDLRRNFAVLVEDCTFTLFHSTESVGTDCFYYFVSFN